MVIAERYTGSSVRRKEDPRILTGRGNYIADVQLPGMIHASFLRSPFPHARIGSIDASAARDAPGVVAVYTGNDMESHVSPGPLGVLAMTGGGGPAFTMLATDKVRLVGDPVALVIAETRYLAEDACELIEVDYEELPAVATAEQALDPGAPLIFEDLGSNVAAGPVANTYGDVEGAFAAADRVVRTRLHQHRHQNVPMETRGGLFSYDPATEELLVWIAGQGVALVQTTLAATTGIPVEKIRVRTGDVGGSFGLKIGAYREDVVCAAASKQLGRPVKWIEDRSENLAASGQAREESFEIEAAVTDEGQILGLKVDMTIDAGAYPGIGAMIGALIESMTPGPYKIGALAFERTAAITNKATYVAYRGPWAAETFLRERTIDIVARELGMEPLEIRRLNVATRDEPPLAMITGRSLAGITVKESLQRLAELIDLTDFRRRQHEARASGRYLGIGMASYIEGAPGPRNGDAPLGREEMRMRVDDDGSVLVFTAQMPHGQSHETTLAQIAADEFGVPFDSVRVIAGDTDVVPAGFTGGSRSATMAGGAALTTARALRSKVLDAAAHLLEASTEDLVISDSGVAVRGVPTSAMSLADLAVAARTPGRLPADIDPELQVSLVYDGGQGGWAGGTHCAIVEIDIETGLVRVDRYLVVEDCGVLINPAVVDGQIRGGVAQGIGAVLLEKSAYDQDGQFLASTFMDYLMPTAVDIPRIEISHLQTVPLDPDVNFRGVGEGGMIVAPVTMCNAIEDALAPFGVRITEQHLPPARILELIGAIPAGE
ncbi:MAG TPA: xanthine dehydrogenase family protein molybdopterin-binding subunit [Acidimicrobiales bacterium]